MATLRTWLACLLMLLVPLQTAAAATKFCCATRGHGIPGAHVSATSGPMASSAQEARHAAFGQELPFSVASVQSGQHASAAECAICATLCHSVGIPATDRITDDPSLSKERPGYGAAKAVSPTLAVPDKPPRT
jgi:hypothetical protein